MTAWIVIACVLGLLLLIALVRVGVKVEYAQEGFFLWVKLGPVRICLLPAAEKESGKKKKRQRKRKGHKWAEEDGKPRAGGSVPLFREMLHLAVDVLGQFKRKLSVDRLWLDFTSAARDPASAAMNFGYANAALGMIWPLLENNFHIRDRQIRTGVDFQRTEPVIYLRAELSLWLGQLLVLGVGAGVRFLKISRKYKMNTKQKEAI